MRMWDDELMPILIRSLQAAAARGSQKHESQAPGNRKA